MTDLLKSVHQTLFCHILDRRAIETGIDFIHTGAAGNSGVSGRSRAWRLALTGCDARRYSWSRLQTSGMPALFWVSYSALQTKALNNQHSCYCWTLKEEEQKHIIIWRLAGSVAGEGGGGTGA